jgi:hypothetical protein
MHFIDISEKLQSKLPNIHNFRIITINLIPKLHLQFTQIKETPS